jgi:hypothetical protein
MASQWLRTGLITAIAAGNGTPIAPSVPSAVFLPLTSFCNGIGINLSGVIIPSLNPYSTIPLPGFPFPSPVGAVSEAMLAYRYRPLGLIASPEYSVSLLVSEVRASGKSVTFPVCVSSTASDCSYFDSNVPYPAFTVTT